MPLPSKDELASVRTTHLLNIWFAITGEQVGVKVRLAEFRDASNEERAAFYTRLCEEIDARIPPTSKPALCTARWHEGLLVAHGAPPDGARCRYVKGHAGDHSFIIEALARGWKKPEHLK
jgi:hypothetical protein